MLFISEMVFASDFEINVSFDDNCVEPESWELPWPRPLNTDRTSMPNSESLHIYNQYQSQEKKTANIC